MTNLSCNITPIQLFGNEISSFVWIKSSSQQDTLVGQQKDGHLSVLKIKDESIVSRFVLDPNLVCAYWDDDDLRQNCQRLFAQLKNGNIVGYTVDSEGVTEVMHIKMSKLISLIDPGSYGASPDIPASLVACEQGHIVVTVGTEIIASVQVTSMGSILPGCILPLPRKQMSTSNVTHDICVFQAINGVLCLFDPTNIEMSMYSIDCGVCICKIDLSLLSLPAEDLLCWKMSYNHSSIMIVKKDLRVHRVSITRYAQENPQAVLMIDQNGRDKSFKHEYFSYHLCRFGDTDWKKEVTGFHAMASEGKLKNIERNANGFTIADKKKTKIRSRTESLESMTGLFMDLSHLNEEAWTISSMEATANVLTILLTRQGMNKDEKGICFVNFSKNNFRLQRLEDSSCIVLSNKPSSLHVICNEKYIQYVAPDPDINKDDLISWMMTYSGPHAADDLCQINQWTRTAIPLTALETSLQQRQLGTLAFFFKSKQELFTTMKQSQRLPLLASEIHQLQTALQLVIEVVAKGIKEYQSRLFAQRLLTLTLDFLYSLFDDARDCLLGGNKTDKQLLDREIQESCQELQHHVSSLRKLMHQFRYRAASQYNSREGSVHSMAMPRDEVDAGSNASIEQYLKDNKLTQLQSFMVTKNSDGISGYRKLLAQVLRKVQKHLQNRDISSCQHLLSNLGCDVEQTLWYLSQFYSNRSFQEFITSQLIGAAGLNKTQLGIVELMSQLYKAYPNESFRSALKMKNKELSNSWTHREDPLKEMIPVVDVFLPSYFTGFDDSAVPGNTDSLSHLYSSVLLAWLSQWSEDLKTGVFIDAQFLSSATSSEDVFSVMKKEPEGTWEFLVSHNLVDTLQLLVCSKSIDDKFPWPFDLLSSLQTASSYVRKHLLGQLLRIGKIPVDSAKDHGIDLQALLSIVGGPMKHPHALAYAGSSAVTEFHQDFITHCVTHCLQLPLWIYCTIHRIDIHTLSVDHKTSWFSSFQLIHAVPRHPKERSLMAACSKLAASDLWSSPSTPMSVEAMLNQGHSMAAMATLSFMPQCDEFLETALIQKHLHPFPKLILALLPEDSPSTKPVTTVYELLMGNVPLDLQRLFGWHGTNRYAGEESPKFMPHFSEPGMTSLRPCRRKLAFPFYLKQGRPLYAFQAFMCEELDRRDSSISEKRVHQACGVALWLACQYFNTSYVTSACVIFVELLGQDSALVRCMVHAGRLMLFSRSRNLSDDYKRSSQDDKRKIKEEKQTMSDEISSELKACIQRRQRHSSKFIVALQTVVTESIDLENLNRTSFEASQKWLLVVMLSQLLHLPLSTTFLEACAHSDNWFMFVWFAQLHQYPTHQLLSLLHHFKSPCYRDHLHYVVCNAENKLFTPPLKTSSAASSSSFDTSLSKGADQGQRTSLYQKIGVNKEKAPSSSEEEDSVERGRIDLVMSSFSSRIRHADFHESEMPESTAPDDVFRLLFYSQSMPSQWRCLLAACVSLRNPLFAELAASCGCPAIPSVCGWLLASLDSASKESFLSQHGQMVSKWKADHLEALIDFVLDRGYEETLATAFTILQPLSPLTSFFCFVNECVKKGKYSSTKTYLNQFKDAMASLEVKSPKNTVREKPTELSTIGDRAWMEKVAYQVIYFYLAHVNSVYEAYHLLDILDSNNIALVFGFDVLNFSLLYQVMEIIHDHEIPNIDLVPLLKSGTISSAFACQCEIAIDHLIQEGKFDVAMQLSEMTKISREKVVLGQLKAEKQKLSQCRVWTSKNVRIQFWERACKLMAENMCSQEACQCFFYEELKETSVEYEKALLCHHLLYLLELKDDPDQDMTVENIFKNMWKHRIASQISIEDQEPLGHIFNDGFVTTKKEEYLKTEIAQTNIDSKTHQDNQEDLSAEEIEVLDSLIGSYLDKGKVKACHKVAAVFGHYSQDLTIIQTCVSLASGECPLEKIEPAMKRLVTKNTRRLSQMMKQQSFSRSRTLSTSSFDSSVLPVIQTPSKNQDSYTLMEKLYGHCTRGRQVCLRVITCFKIAEIIDTTYQDVVFGAEFEILRRVLKTDHIDRFTLAKDFLATSGLSDDEVTVFLADSIVDMLKNVVRGEDMSDDEQSKGQKQLFNANDGQETFTHILKLCENTSLLGDCILQAVASFASEDDGELSAKVLTIQTEMIIMAHECYTTASNMEGISHVLRAARICSNCLAQAGEFSLMIRLLLGVGRYSEMLYIFHALQQNHQFELLLKKGMDREDKLKVAILDYLKRYQPDDNETYTMVALKFTMFRDIAVMLEKCGHKALKTFKDKKHLENTRETQEVLKNCLHYFKDAAESYMKDASVRKAQHCVRFARLMSLQLQLLSSGMTVIHLSKDEVKTFTNTHPRFIEAMVVSEAYDTRADWAGALYNNVVVGGEKSYLHEMQLHVHLTSTLIEDVVSLYQRAAVKPSGAMTGIRKLLGQCKDAQLRYKLACDLGLTDIVTTMLKSDAGSYLQDVSLV